MDAVYQSPIPWKRNVETEAIAIHCGDPRFKEHFNDFLKQHLNFPHTNQIIIPGGVTLMLPLIGKGFKLGKQMIELVTDTSKARRIVCIAHEDCTMYREHRLAEWALRKFIGKDIKELQIEHLKESGETFRIWFPSSEVLLFYASIEKRGDIDQIVFSKVT